MYSFTCIPTAIIKIHMFNYMVITYERFSLWSYNKDHCAQDKLANPFIYTYATIYQSILYMYKFLRDVIFEVFAVNWPSAKFSSLKFHCQTLAVMCLVD